MSRMLIRPGIVWALDEIALREARAWHDRLDPDRREFARVVSDAEQAGEALRAVNRDEFRSRAERDLGLATDPLGSRVTATVIANGMGPNAFADWTSTWSMLDRLEREVVALERHVVLLARHEDHQVQQRKIRVEEVPVVPWLVSTRADDGLTVSEETFRRVLASLLSVLNFMDRGDQGDEPTQRFREALPERGRVRLVGFSSIPLEAVIQELTTRATQVLIGELRDPGAASPMRRQECVARLNNEMRDFLLGGSEPRKILRTVLGRDGVGGFEPGPLLHEGPTVLESLTDSTSPLGRAVNGEHLGLERLPAVWSKRGWRRWLEECLWRLRLIPEARYFRERRCRRLPEELQALRSRIEFARDLVQSVGAQARPTSVPTNEIPRQVLDRWRADLEKLLHDDLDAVIDQQHYTERSAEKTWRELLRCVDRDVDQELASALIAWGLRGPVVARFAEALANGRALRFTGRLAAGQSYEPAAVISTLFLPATIKVHQHEVNLVHVREWKASVPLLVAATRPIPAEALAW